jgi:16S rRNA (cytidine1402-2'-O)-methyltransferase
MIYFVPTPVGNLEDITLRSLNLLKTCDFVFCEDWKISSNLFRLLEIENKPNFVDLIKNNALNYKIEETLKNNLEANICIITDAGTPGISDPGFEVIRICQKLDLKYTVLPGATAFVPAIVASGLVSKEFWYIGFLPLKKGRQALWKKIAQSEIPVILYESVHRIAKTILEINQHLGPNTQICIGREISKKFETYYFGNPEQIANLEIVEKGEFVVVIRN